MSNTTKDVNFKETYMSDMDLKNMQEIDVIIAKRYAETAKLVKQTLQYPIVVTVGMFVTVLVLYNLLLS